MPLRVRRVQVLGIAAILALFFVAEYAFRDSFEVVPQSQAQASAQR
jgi:hypothetical protein